MRWWAFFGAIWFGGRACLAPARAMPPAAAAPSGAPESPPAADHAFAPPLNPGPPPDASEWRLSGWALSPSGTRFARTWAYDDATDRIAGFSGAVELWDVASGAKVRTVTGVPGGLCDIDPGGRDCAQWLDERTLGLVFNTNAVGILTLGDKPALAHGAGDPTGRDSGPSWGSFPSGRWLVGFPASWGPGPSAPLALWDPKTGSLSPFAPGQVDAGFGRFVRVDGGLLGIRPDALALMSESRLVARAEQVRRPAHELRGGPAAYAQHAREQASPDGRHVVADQVDGLWLLSGSDLGRVRQLAPPDAVVYPAAFAWSRDGAQLAVAYLGARDKKLGHVQVFRTGGDPGLRVDGPVISGGGVHFASYFQPIAFSADGSRVALLRGERVDVVDTTTGTVIRSLPAAPDTLHLVVGAGDVLLLVGEAQVAFDRL